MRPRHTGPTSPIGLRRSTRHSRSICRQRQTIVRKKACTSEVGWLASLLAFMNCPRAARPLSALIMCLVVGCGPNSQSLPPCKPETIAFPTPSPDAEVRQLSGRSLLIRNAGLRDGRGGPVQKNIDILVRDGRVAEIGRGLSSRGVPVIDASGLFLLPGLITSHAHLQSVPGSVLRRDDIAAIRAQQTLQLRAYLASGFTAVLDPAIGPETARRLLDHARAGRPSPEIFVLAPFVTPVDGYMTSPEMRGAAFADFWPAVGEETNLVEFFQSADALRPVGVKVAIEDGVVFPNLPVFKRDVLRRIREAGRQTGRRLYVHSITNEEHRVALSLNPYALVHVGGWDEPLDEDILAKLKEKQTYVITTASLQPLSNWGWHPRFATDRWIQARVPIVQWLTALHPSAKEHLSALISVMMKPSFVPAFLARMTASWFVPSPEDAARFGANSAATVKRLHANGVPWVIGADEGNSPAYTTFFHGVASQIELELLDEAGLPREAILAAATTTPAKMLGVSDRLGTIEVGKQADLILLDTDPVDVGMAAFRSLRWTIKRGEARTPAAWLVAP